jgi:hexokinase
LYLNNTIGQRSLSHGDPQRDTDELAIGELHTRSVFTIIHRDIDAAGLQVCIQCLGGLSDSLRLIHAKGDKND